jgi:ankyrin repeat protein
MVAALGGNTEVLGLLLEHHAKVNLKDKNNHTALMEAALCTEERVESVVLLLRHGADARAVNNLGRTPYDLARNHEIQKLLYAAMIR